MWLSLSLSTFFFLSSCHVMLYCMLFISDSVMTNKKGTCSQWRICMRRRARMMTQIMPISHSHSHWREHPKRVAIHLCQCRDTATAVTAIFVWCSLWFLQQAGVVLDVRDVV
jgi:hypothetical protein